MNILLGSELRGSRMSQRHITHAASVFHRDAGGHSRTLHA